MSCAWAVGISVDHISLLKNIYIYTIMFPIYVVSKPQEEFSIRP